MSTPIDDIPDDVNELQEDFYQEPSVQSWIPPASSKQRGYFQKYKEYFLVLLAALVTLNVPMSLARGQLPYQAFRFGDAPILSVMILILYVILKQLSSAL